MGLLFRLVFLYAPLAAIAAAGLAVVYGIEDHPLVSPRAKLNLPDIAHRRLLAGAIVLTAEEVDALLDHTVARSDQVRVEATVRPYGLVLAATVTLPARLAPIGRYVNLRVAVPPSQTGFEVSRLAIGRIDVPSTLIKPAFGLVLDLLGGGQGPKALDGIKSVSFAGDRMMVMYRPSEP